MHFINRLYIGSTSRFKSCLATAIVLSLASGILQAGEYYVSPTGSAQWSQCTNINTPCSPATAMKYARAGDTTYFRGGVYSITGGLTPYHGLLEPSNTGTAGNPIVFMAYNKEVPNIKVNCTAPENHCNVLGTNAKNYITWDGFLLTALNNKTAGAFIGGEHLSAPNGAEYSTGAVFKNNTIIAGSSPVPYTDNHDITRLEWTRQARFYNNIVGGLKTISPSDNNAALKMYHNDQAVIENNEFFGSPYGISAKSDQDNTIVRNNFFHDNYIDYNINIFASGEPWYCPNNRIENNVFANFKYMAITVQADNNNVADADNLIISNNTIYTKASGSSIWATYLGNTTNLQIYNNIIIAPSQITTKGDHNTLAAADHNQYGNSNLFNELNRYNSASAYSSLSSWKSSGKLIGGTNPGTGSLASDPLFANVSGTMTKLADFELSSGSPSKGAGRNGVDMGANIKLVGPSLISPPKPPTIVTN